MRFTQNGQNNSEGQLFVQEGNISGQFHQIGRKFHKLTMNLELGDWHIPSTRTAIRGKTYRGGWNARPRLCLDIPSPGHVSSGLPPLRGTIQLVVSDDTGYWRTRTPIRLWRPRRACGCRINVASVSSILPHHLGNCGSRKSSPPHCGSWTSSPP